VFRIDHSSFPVTFDPRPIFVAANIIIKLRPDSVLGT
jgi:hypothetical protein